MILIAGLLTKSLQILYLALSLWWCLCIVSQFRNRRTALTGFALLSYFCLITSEMFGWTDTFFPHFVKAPAYSHALELAWSFSVLSFFLYATDHGQRKLSARLKVLSKLPLVGLLLGYFLFTEYSGLKVQLIGTISLLLLFPVFLRYKQKFRLAFRWFCFFSVFWVLGLLSNWSPVQPVFFKLISVACEVLAAVFLYQLINFFLVQEYTLNSLEAEE